jgi:hypothetical protein
MKPNHKFKIFAGLLSLLMYTTAYAGNAVFDFESDPSTTGLTLYGNHAPDAWRSDGGNPGGYLSLTDASGGQNTVAIFPDFDNGLIVKAFTFSMDVRVGNPVGNSGRPADGFSISFARDGDPVLTSGDGSGFANGLPEAGTTTGIAIGFDSWAGNTLPDGADIEGIIVRVDNKTVLKYAMPTRNGSLTDPTSIQTGPWDGNADNPDGTGSWENLGWAKLEVELNESGQLTVKYKGTTLLDKYQTQFFPSAGRLVLAGRTGGANQNQHVDNIRITTIPAESVLFSGIKSYPYGCILSLSDVGQSILNPASIQVKFNNEIIPTNKLTITKKAEVTTIVYDSGSFIPVGQTNVVDILFSDTRGVKGSNTVTFVTEPYVALNSDFVNASVDKNSRGFLIRPYTTEENNPNSLIWTEQQLAGLHGENLANLSDANADGFIEWNGLINFDISSGAGHFTSDTGYPDEYFPGLPGSQTRDQGTGNATMEILTYLEFPAAGVYQLGVTSDDGFRVTASWNPLDRLGIICGQFDGGRGWSDGDSIFTIVVPKAGFYPFRLIWENGNGGCNLEWYSVKDGKKILINDSTNPDAIKAYMKATNKLSYISWAEPLQRETDVYANKSIKIVIADGDTPVKQNSINLTLNNKIAQFNVTKVGISNIITIPNKELFGPNSSNSISLSFEDSAKTYSYNWSFIVGSYSVLSTDVASKPGSADTSKRGFLVKTYQLQNRDNTMANNNEWAEGIIAGLLTPNMADLTEFKNGIFEETTTINYGHTTGRNFGNFPDDRQHPGIPGQEGSTVNYVSEIVTYIEFSEPGFYVMGVNSDDNFKVTLSDKISRQIVEITTPGLSKKAIAAVASVNGLNAALGGPIPKVPIEGDVVFVGTAVSDITQDLTGKIALIERGGDTFVNKITRAQKAGAIAAIIHNQEANAGLYPIIMGGDGPNITIPSLMIDYADGMWMRDNINGLRISIGQDSAQLLGEYNGNGRGSADTLFSFYVPVAGVYPFRCLYLNGGGDGNIEWFTVINGQKVLLNDDNGIKTYRARTFIPIEKPTISIGRQNQNIVVTFKGKLQAADQLTGPWSDVINAQSPYVVPGNMGPIKFFRAQE